MVQYLFINGHVDAIKLKKIRTLDCELARRQEDRDTGKTGRFGPKNREITKFQPLSSFCVTCNRLQT